MWQDLRVINSLNRFETHLHYFDSLLNTQDDLKELIENNPVHFSYYPDNSFLITFNLKELSDEKLFKEKLNHFFVQPAGIKVSAQINDGVFGISNSEQRLRTVFDRTTAKLQNNKNFQLLKSTANYSGNEIYINHQGLFYQSYSAATILPESISLNGLSAVDSISFYGDMKASPLNSYECLTKVPLLCNSFEIFTTGNAETLFNNKNENDWWNNVNEAALFNAKKQFYDNIGEYIITATLPSKNTALILSQKDSLKIAELLPFMKDTTYSHLKILKLKKNNSSFCKSTFSILKLNEPEFLVAFNDYIVFTKTESDAEIFANSFVNNSSILNNSSFNAYASKNFDTDFHYLKYLLTSSLSKEQLPLTELMHSSDITGFKNISHCSYLSTFKNNFRHYRFFIKYFQEDVSGEPDLLWTFNSDTLITTCPNIFKNHLTKGNEVVFQTIDKNLYLINATGKTIWKKKLIEEVRSEIFMVDAFKNKKYQLLFNTDNYLHLIDRNGNYVQGYPVKLPAKATNKLSVLDYENKNDLRLFIACADSRIYNYTIYGIKHEGYKPMQTMSPVSLPIKYCKVGLSDYLITGDRKGRIYAFSRKGDGRIDFKNKLLESLSDFEIESGNSLSQTQLIYFDEKNHLINKISLADKKEIYKTLEEEGTMAYAFEDADNNKITDVIVAGKESVAVYNITGTKNTEMKTGIANPFAVNYHKTVTNARLSVFDVTNSTISLINVEQNTFKDYPATQEPFIFDLFNDGKSYLLIANGNKIKCFKL